MEMQISQRFSASTGVDQRAEKVVATVPLGK
jgi:hypothetical protein